MKAAAVVLAALLLQLSGCSTQPLAIERAAAPFGLKLIEAMLAERPEHRGLLLAGARGFTQYAYAFVQQDAEEAEERSLAESLRLEERALGFYARARDYGLRGLALGRPDFERALRVDPRRAAAALPASEVPLLYWTAASWAALIALCKDSPEALAELPVVEALIERALELDESFERGAIHTFLIAYEPVRQGGSGNAAQRAREHFRRAMELSEGTAAAPLVALAEAVSVPQQERAEFEELLKRALRIELDSPQDRMANLVAQRRARWLLSRTERLFTN